MLFLLSPAKSLDYETPVPRAVQAHVTEPAWPDAAGELIALMRRLQPQQVAALMDLSEPLVRLNVERYAAWQAQPTPANSKPAVLAFDGDVYDGLQACSLTLSDLRWAQDHLRILSGLYGLLRPLDALQPYRLEMGTALANPRGRNLYAWWGDRVAEALNELQADEARPVIVNLASAEYARAALRPALRARVVDCVFEELNPDGRPQIISFFAKKARGQMVRFAIEHRARSVQALQAFAVDGYAFVAAASAADTLVFRRPRPPAMKAARAAAGAAAGAPA